MSTKLLQQSALYSIGKLFIFLAGLISYPILTKTLSIEEYGTVALLTVSIGLMSTFIKFGVQQSIIRFRRELDKYIFSTNIIALSVSVTSLATVFLFLSGSLIGRYSELIIFQNPFFIIILSSALLQALQSFCINILISLEKSLIVTTLGIFYKVFSLSTMLIAILIISSSALSFIYALLLADVIYFLILLFWIFKNNYLNGFSKELIDKTIIKNFLIFGIPMFGYELANMFHAFSDRFLIEIFLGRETLGLYSASYNMAKMMSDLILGGLITAILPQYLALWKKEGKEATEKLVSKVNSLILLFGPFFIAGIYATAENLLILLTTKQYSEHAYLLPIIFFGSMLFSLGIIYSAGLQIAKKSPLMLKVVLESAILNLLLNVVLISKFGMISAAINTVISYTWACARFYFLGRKILHIHFDFWLLIRASSYSILMYLIISNIYLPSIIFTLISKIVIGATIAILLVGFFEKQLRTDILILVKNKFNKV